MEAVATGVNRGVAQFQSRGMLYAIEQDLNISIGLVQPHRVYIRSGVFEGKTTQRSRPNSYHLYLMNDLIILAKDGEYLDRVSLQVLFVYDGAGCEFTLVMPTSTVNERIILSASNESDKEEWVELLVSTINALMEKKPLYKNQRTKMAASYERKSSMTLSERRQQLKEDKKESKRNMKKKADERFQTMRF
eukprot:TRINITY_DN12033_c0_g1_i1.p1 TRINITY_DN12033_c0_g1~~TRINITY_DN12033_c0_g1_i1.p1  ORF type:complete len:191 (-),score=38.91 TRINITY_DN12033_c0_g1_i1:135-707(-)